VEASLDRIKSELLAQLRSDTKFSFVNTRLILKTGVSLRDYKAEEATDPRLVARVLGALLEQGFTFTKGMTG
jgi:hypothetical protein